MGFIRICAAVNKVRAGNPQECLEEIIKLINQMPDCDFAVFPALALSGNCGGLLTHPALVSQREAALRELAALTSDKDCRYVIGDDVLYKGGRGEIPDKLILTPTCIPMYAGRFDEIRASARAASYGRAIVHVNGGVGETSSPGVYNGFIIICEDGKELMAEKAGYESMFRVVDIDADIIGAAGLGRLRGDILRDISPSPFVPQENAAAYLSELFDLQVRSLVGRMENIGVSRLVVGVSGGLDSTAALLCSAAAVDILGLPRSNITAITMPGFGTSDATHYNALCLMRGLCVTCRDISIRQSVTVHFEDIGHSGKKDVVYENAQARERAQILLDVANAVGGIVVGTGDLSEAALGFTTFAGDHIANYNVNASITKTALRALVGHIAAEDLVKSEEPLAEVLAGILDTPVSPELLPAEEDGAIRQKTEDILAPYELLDFFLYYFIKYRFPPKKLALCAGKAFGDKYPGDYINEKLRMFITRFCAAQFKRACSPDGAALTEVNLSGFYIPSDMDPAGLLRDLEN